MLVKGILSLWDWCRQVSWWVRISKHSYYSAKHPKATLASAPKYGLLVLCICASVHVRLLNRTCPYMRVADFSYKGWLATADHHCYRCLRILAYIFRNPFPSDIMADYSCFRDQVVVITGKLAKHFLMLYGGMASLDILVYWSKCPRKITYGRYFYYTSFWLCLQCWIKYINLNINTTCVNDSNHLHM